jgi:hypothetical protein
MEVSRRNCEEQNPMDIPFSTSMQWQPFVNCFHLTKTTCGHIRQQTEGLLKKELNIYTRLLLIKLNGRISRMLMYWENWPVAQPFLLFGADAYKNKEWFDTWKKLDHSPTCR